MQQRHPAYDPFTGSDYVEETPIKQGGLLASDISTLKKPNKDYSSKLTSHERLGPEAHSNQTSMHKHSTLNLRRGS